MLFDIKFRKTKHGFSATNHVLKKQINIWSNGTMIYFGTNYMEVVGKYLPYQYRSIHTQYLHHLLPTGFTSNEIPDFWKKKMGDKPMPKKVISWIRKKADIYTRKEFVKYWNEFISNKLDSRVRLLSKSICRTIGPSRLFLIEDDINYIINNEYLLSDLLNYNAAVYAVLDISNIDNIEYNADNWMEYYSSDRKTYTSLNKTLMKLPAKLPVSIPTLFRSSKRLTYPLYGRCKIVFCLNDDRELHPPHARRNRECAYKIFDKSSNDDIIKAARLGRKLGLQYKMNRLSEIFEFKHYLLEYPEEYHGDICGLVKRSVEWHRRFYNNVGYGVSSFTPDTKLASPSWGEFNIKGIRRLTTVGDLNNESKVMEHCVSTYARQCIKGYSFIYHIDYRNSQATIEVDSSGKIVQAQGKRNRKTPACKWGTNKILKILKKGKVKKPLMALIPF